MRTDELVLAVVLGFAIAAGASAQTPPSEHESHHPAADPAANPRAPMSEGEVRKIDRDARKVTLRHGPIPNLEMPEMTMVFRVADPKMLDGLEVRQKIQFTAERIEGQITLTSIGPVD